MKTLKTISKSGIACFLLCITLLSGCNEKQDHVILFSEAKSELIDFALNEIQKACLENNMQYSEGTEDQANVIIKISTDKSDIESEGFQLLKNDSHVLILASSHSGAMYGGLELAEQISIYGFEGIQSTNQNPYMEMRGTKFNIPLDVRTPSYTDPCDAAQKNIPEMWNFDFWTEYIDHMARNRYNFISLWSLHPFPSMVKVPGYEDVALDDVRRSTVEWKEYYHTWGTGFDAPEILNNYEVLKKITIDEKIKFWQQVMAYAKTRNVTFYVITWNIFVNGTDGKYGITDQIDNEVTIDYFKESVKSMFRTYPELGGIGLATGENMHGIPFDEKEDWAFNTYAKGLLEIANEMPDREFKFIHRQHMSDPKAIEEKFAPLIAKDNVDFIYSFKYAKAHVMSTVQQPYHEDFVKNIGDIKTIWTLRNDDNYYFRWGAPDFVREFVKNIPYDVSQGMYYGSDQWIWGREFTMKDVEDPRQLEVVKHWYHWLMWGRLCYNPEIPNDHFIGLLQNKFPETDAEILFEAWQEASMIYPVTTGFHWGTIDIKWYIEGCRSRPNNAYNETGFHDVNTFLKLPVHDYSGCITIPDYAKTVANGKSTTLKTPFDVAQTLHGHADKSFDLLNQLEGENQTQELKYTLHDIKTMAAMGKYYAHKIAGSTNVALYRETKDKKYQEEAVAQLTKALEYWEKYAEIAMEQNINPIWTNRVGYVDWVETTEWVKQDIEIARNN